MTCVVWNWFLWFFRLAMSPCLPIWRLTFGALRCWLCQACSITVSKFSFVNELNVFQLVQRFFSFSTWTIHLSVVFNSEHSDWYHISLVISIGYFQQVRRYRETYRFWNIWRPHKSQFLCNYTGQLTSIAFYGQNGSVQNKLSNHLFLNVNLFPVLKKLFLLKSNGSIASCPYFQWEKIDKLFKNENFNLAMPTPVLQLVPLENTQCSTEC
jgi:hypothetical protein